MELDGHEIKSSDYLARYHWLKQRALSENIERVNDIKLAFKFLLRNFDKFDKVKHPLCDSDKISENVFNGLALFSAKRFQVALSGRDAENCLILLIFREICSSLVTFTSYNQTRHPKDGLPTMLEALECVI